MEKTRKLWRRRDIASYLGVTPKTIHNWRLEGRIEAVKLPGGQHRYMLPRELEETVDNG